MGELLGETFGNTVVARRFLRDLAECFRREVNPKHYLLKDDDSAAWLGSLARCCVMQSRCGHT
jgi:hypothetical protein